MLNANYGCAEADADVSHQPSCCLDGSTKTYFCWWGGQGTVWAASRVADMAVVVPAFESAKKFYSCSVAASEASLLLNERGIAGSTLLMQCQRQCCCRHCCLCCARCMLLSWLHKARFVLAGTIQAREGARAGCCLNQPTGPRGSSLNQDHLTDSICM